MVARHARPPRSRGQPPLLRVRKRRHCAAPASCLPTHADHVPAPIQPAGRSKHVLHGVPTDDRRRPLGLALLVGAPGRVGHRATAAQRCVAGREDAYPPGATVLPTRRRKKQVLERAGRGGAELGAPGEGRRGNLFPVALSNRESGRGQGEGGAALRGIGRGPQPYAPRGGTFGYVLCSEPPPRWASPRACRLARLARLTSRAT